MAVYGRIEEVSETIQSNEIENRLDRNLESHVEKEEQVAFPFFRLIIGSTIATVFSVVLPLLLDMVSPSQAQDLYIGWALHQGGQLYSSYYAGQGLSLLFTTLHYPRRHPFCLGRMASPLRRRLFPLFCN